MTKKRTFFSPGGFTLFEIMVVVMIVGLLLAIALPNLIEARNRARRDICISNQKIIFTAATMYNIDNPEGLQSLNDAERLQALIDNGYLRGQKWTECPASNDDDYDDYTIIFENGIVSDVECDEWPVQHKWP